MEVEGRASEEGSQRSSEEEGSRRSNILLTGLFIEKLGLVFDSDSDNNSKGRSADLRRLS